LRNQLSIRPGEDKISPQDERLLLSQHWMENVPAAHDIFVIWEEANPVSAFFQHSKEAL
jgi:nucleolar pre-ribosomal-associated protein 1